MKAFRKLISGLLVPALMLALPFLSASATQETAETAGLSIPSDILAAAVTAVSAEDAEPAETAAPAEDTEPAETAAPAEDAEPAEDAVTEAEDTAVTLNAGTAGTWDTCTVLIEGTLCYEYAFDILDMLNEFRTANGLDPLVMDTAMLEHAMLRAAETAVYWEHTRPDGSSCNYGCDIVFFHENIAHVYTTPQQAFNGWKNSSGHCENMLTASLKTVGIGVFYVDGNYYWVQDFSRNSSSVAYESNYKDYKTSLTLTVADFLVEDYAEVALSDSSLNVGDTASFSVNYTLYPSFELPASGLSYSTSDASVCTVSADGTVTAEGAGTATVTAWYPGYKAGAWTFTVTVTVPKHTCSYKGVVTTAAGCESDGIKTYTCSICKKSYTETVPATGHSLSKTGTVTREPGCTSFGKRIYACANCDYTESALIAPTGHSYDSGKVTAKPTSGADGTRLYTCSACGSTRTETISFLLGDVTMNEKVNTTDLIRLMKHLTGQSVTVNKNAADTNADGSIDLLDVIRLTRHLTEGKKLG